MFWFRYEFIDDQVQQFKKDFGCGAIVTKVYLPRMDSVVSNYPDGVESLLQAHIKTGSYKCRNVLIDVLAWLTKLLAKFLNSQADQGGGAPRR
ncbi:hypothetical protein D3C73_1309310 [compost metagenome]